MLLTYSNLDRLLSIRCVSPHGVDQNDSLASTACLSFYSHSANPFSLFFYSHSANTFSLSFVPGRQLNKIFHHSTISNGCMERQVAEKRQPWNPRGPTKGSRQTNLYLNLHRFSFSIYQNVLECYLTITQEIGFIAILLMRKLRVCLRGKVTCATTNLKYQQEYASVTVILCCFSSAILSDWSNDIT